jgi:hypothetical protein
LGEDATRPVTPQPSIEDNNKELDTHTAGMAVGMTVGMAVGKDASGRATFLQEALLFTAETVTESIFVEEKKKSKVCTQSPLFWFVV